MTVVDGLVLLALLPFALRGYFRGFCRETFALLGLVRGTLLSAAWGPRVAASLVAHHVLGEPWVRPAAYALVFAAAVLTAALLGRVAAGVARAIFLGPLDRVAGTMVATLKGAALVGLGLLAAERLDASPALTARISASRLGRPLEEFAAAVLEAGRALTAESHA